MKTITINETKYKIIEELDNDVKVVQDNYGNKSLVNKEMKCSNLFDDKYEITDFGFIIYYKDGYKYLLNKEMKCSCWFKGSYEIIEDGYKITETKEYKW